MSACECIRSCARDRAQDLDVTKAASGELVATAIDAWCADTLRLNRRKAARNLATAYWLQQAAASRFFFSLRG